jgi:hypothetical protein
MKLFSTLVPLALAASLGGQMIEGIPDMAKPLRSGEVCVDNDCILTSEQFLQRGGYASTFEGLAAALHDSRAEFRSLAAEELAREQKAGALRALLEAFSIERAPGTQVFMAGALAALGDESGLPTLQRLCRGEGDPDPAHRAAVRLLAAGSMVRLGRDTCNDDVIDTLRYYVTAPNVLQGGRVNNGLTLVLGFRHVSANQSKEVRDLAETCVRGEDAGARMLASDILGRYGDAGSAQKLKSALAVERDVTARARMEAALRRLEGDPHGATDATKP